MIAPGRTALLLLALAAACREEKPPARSDDESLAQRVFVPPPGVVRAVPPHPIQVNRIGPYALGGELQDVLNTLPHGPRVELLQIDRLASYRLVRVAQDSILVGIGGNGRVAFIAALDPEIAKTEGGLGVGSDMSELRAALGPEVPLAGARDPRLVELEQLPNARVVTDGGRAIAIVLGLGTQGAEEDLGPADALSGGATQRPAARRAAEGRRGRDPAPEESDGTCTAESAAEALADQSVAAIARADENPVIHYGCFVGPAPEAVVVTGDQLILVVGEPGHMRRAAAVAVPDLAFASAVDSDGDGRHELVLVSAQRTADLLTISVEVLRGENGRLVGVGADEVYRVTSTAAAPVGAKVKDIDLLVEASAGGEIVAVSGFYLHRVGGAVRSVAPLMPKTVALKPRRRSDAGAASPPPPAAASRGARGARPGGPERKRSPARQEAPR